VKVHEYRKTYNYSLQVSDVIRIVVIFSVVTPCSLV